MVLFLVRNLRELRSAIPLMAIGTLRFISGGSILASDIHRGIETGFTLRALKIGNVNLHFAPPSFFFIRVNAFVDMVSAARALRAKRIAKGFALNFDRAGDLVMVSIILLLRTQDLLRY